MRSFLLAAMAAVALYGAGLGDAAGQSSGNGRKLSDDDNNRWMFVENESDFTAHFIYIIPSEKACCWSPDLLGREVIIRRGETWVVNFDNGSNDCVFDIRAVDAVRGIEWHFDWVNVCRNATITLLASDKKDRRMRIKNESDVDAYYIYRIPSNRDCCWSRDLLGKNIIPKGKDLDVDFDNADGQCEFDIRVTTRKADDKEWNFDHLNVCSKDGRRPMITLK